MNSGCSKAGRDDQELFRQRAPAAVGLRGATEIDVLDPSRKRSEQSMNRAHKDQTGASEAFSPGARLGDWIVEERVSAGASTILYRAREVGSGVPAIIKQYAPGHEGVDAIGTAVSEDGASDATAEHHFQAFIRDAHQLCTLAAGGSVPGLVTVLELIQANGTAYAVMDLEAGTPLSALIDAGPHFDEQSLGQILRSIVHGLSKGRYR